MAKLNWLGLGAIAALIPNANDIIRFDGMGAALNSSTINQVGISCGIGQDTAWDTNDDVYVYFNDRSSDAGQSIWCETREVNSDFSTIIYVGVKYACSTGGGCTTDPGGAYTGESWLTFANIQHGADFSTNVFCAIARVNSSSQSSYVKTLYLDAQ
jgi:hypothetical protein